MNNPQQQARFDDLVQEFNAGRPREALAMKSPADVYRLLRAMLHYLRAFPKTLHHPKEAAYLFQRLRTRAPAFNAVIDELQGQHRDGAALLEGLDKAVDDHEASGATALGALSDTLERFTKAQWQHMDLEEGGATGRPTPSCARRLGRNCRCIRQEL